MSLTLVHALVWAPVAATTAVAMDLWAAFLHGRVWHRALWSIHRSHHGPARPPHLEANDALSLLHAPIAIVLVLFGCAARPSFLREAIFGAGIGMSLFGVAYAVVHDGLVHGRLPVRFLGRIAYVRRIRRAHRLHHSGRAGGLPYGLFFGPWELERAKHVTPGRPSIARAPAPTSRRH